jgi:hypothetical protein
MTTIVRIEHAVSGFDAWMGAFKNDPVGRQKSGVRRYRILRPKDDPNFVMVDLEFDSAKEAENFGSAMRNLWNSPEAQRVMKNPQLRIVELVETREV